MTNKAEWPRLVGVEPEREGFLIDREIASALEKGQLVTDGNVMQAKYACYELRIGPEVQQLVLEKELEGRNDLYRVKRVGDDGTFQIYPGETFKIIASEKLYIPADVFAIAIPVGNLYRLGLSPETTFADPGFAREFFVTVNNYSPRVVTLKVGDPLSRVFFFKLHVRPDRIHEGNPREMPPTVARIGRPKIEDLRRKGMSTLLAEVLAGVDPPHYQHAFVTSEFLTLRRNWAVSALASISSLSVIVLMALLYLAAALQKWWPSLFEGILVEVIATVAAVCIPIAIGPFRRAIVDAIGVLASKES